MSGPLDGRTVAVLAADGVEQVELTRPVEALEEAGANVRLVSVDAGDIQGFNHLDKGDWFAVDAIVEAVDADAFDALVLPGGVANPDFLRTDEGAVAFVADFFAQDKPVGVICHGPWTLIEADVVRGRTLTSWPSLRTDLRNAGATWVDEEVHVDGKLVSSRKPDDLDAFCAAIVTAFA